MITTSEKHHFVCLDLFYISEQVIYCALLFLSYSSIVNIKGCKYSQILNYHRWDSVKQTEVRQDKTKDQVIF